MTFHSLLSVEEITTVSLQLRNLQNLTHDKLIMNRYFTKLYRLACVEGKH